jgi:hypothetical protein
MPININPEKGLENYGRMVGKYPLPTCALGAVISIIMIAGWSQAKLDQEHFQFVWSVEGSDLERELRLVWDLQNTSWKQDFNTLIFTGKNDGDDIYTPEAFLEMFDLYYTIFNENFTVAEAGEVYHIWDLCFRGSFPDLPASIAPFPRLPCLHITPLLCFSEMLPTFTPLYQFCDANNLLPDVMTATLYHLRPSVATVTARQLKDEVMTMRSSGARGCNWFTDQVTVGKDFWGGSYQIDANGTMHKGECATILLFMDAPRRASWRLQLTQPAKTNVDELETAIDDFNQKLEDYFDDVADNYNYIDISFLKIEFFEDVMEENSEIPLMPIILSYILVGFLVSFSLANFQLPSRSHAGIGLQALFCVFLSMMVAGGLIGWGGVAWNPASLQCLPFLAIGLGVNDMFVLILALAEHGQMRCINDGPGESLACVLGHGGVGVTLTSVCNIFAFGIGAVIPVSGVSNFCLGASCVAASNYFVVMTIFAFCIYNDAKRLINKGIDPSCVTCMCHQNEGCNKSTDELDPKGWGCSLQDRITTYYVPFIANPIVAVAALIVTAALFIGCLVSILNISMGILVEDLISEDSPKFKGVNKAQQHVATWTVWMFYYELDIPPNQINILNTLSQMLTISGVIPNSVPPWLTLFYFVYVLNVAPVPAPAEMNLPPNTTMGDVGFNFESPIEQGTNAFFGPFGAANPALFYTMFNLYRRVPYENPLSFLTPAGQMYYYADLGGVNEFSYNDTGATEHGIIKLGFDKFLSLGISLSDTEEMVDFIDAVRGGMEDQPIGDSIFPWGVQFTYFEIYRDLVGIFWTTLGIDMAVIFFFSVVFLCAPIAAVCCTLMIGVVIVEIFGTSGLFVQFNFISASALLMSVGISVDFIVHFVATFQISVGDKKKKLTDSLCSVAPAVILGGVSTVLSLLPVGFSTIPFTRKYFFGLFMVVTGYGLFNGLFVLPAIMGLFFCGKAVKSEEI